jgi:hypothetical protein
LQALELVTVSSTGALYRRVPPHSTTGSPVAQFTDPSQPDGAFATASSG